MENASAPFSYSFFSSAQQPLVGQDLLIIEASRSYSDTPHLLGLLCTCEQPDVGTVPANTQQTQETVMQAPGGFRNRNPTKRAAADHALGFGHTESGLPRRASRRGKSRRSAIW